MDAAVIEICNRKSALRDFSDSLPSLSDAKRQELYASYAVFANGIGDVQFLRRKYKTDSKAASAMIEAAAEGVRKCVVGVEDGELEVIVTYKSIDGFEEDYFLAVKGLAAHTNEAVANVLIDAYRQASGKHVASFVEAFTPIF